MTATEATPTRELRLDEPDGVWSVLLVPADRDGRRGAAIAAARAIVEAAPPSDGRSRSLERLAAGDDAAGLLACQILSAVLGGA